MISFLHSFQSEWLKKKRSAASWLMIGGSLFIPFIMLLVQFYNGDKLAAQSQSSQYWQMLFNKCWESMALLLLPMGIILSTSLICQLEFKNNAWKQLHSTAQKFSTVFFAKFSIVLVMLLQLFILFTIGIWLVGLIPNLILGKPLPAANFPIMSFLKTSAMFYLDCLPIIALQYLLSLHYKNFLVPVAVGLVLVVGSLVALHWKFGYIVPYTYCAYSYLQLAERIPAGKNINVHLLSLVYFSFFTLTGYILYITKKEKG
ncbi:MAG: ABC transporter permease [Ferruginibacter sp.]